MSIIKKCYLKKNQSKLKLKINELKLRNKDKLNYSDTIDVIYELTDFPRLRSNPLSLKINGYYIEIKSKNNKGINASLVIKKIKLKDFCRINKIVKSICWLSSFAGSTFVQIANYEILKNAKSVEMHLFSKYKNLSHTKYAIIHDETDNKLLKDFIENSISYCIKRKNEYLLDKLIHILLLAIDQKYLEIKTLLLANFLEILKFNYAMKVASVDFKYTGKGFSKKNNGFAGFKDIIDHFCNKFKLTGFNPKYVDIRNDIVHEGKIDSNKGLSNYLDLHEFCNRVILTLLEYKGSYTPFIERINSNDCRNWREFSK